jgi:hypothetical protein
VRCIGCRVFIAARSTRGARCNCSGSGRRATGRHDGSAGEQVVTI